MQRNAAVGLFTKPSIVTGLHLARRVFPAAGLLPAAPGRTPSLRVVGRIKAPAFQDEPASRGNEPFNGTATDGTLGKGGVRYLLKLFEFMPALSASVFIGRHYRLSLFSSPPIAGYKPRSSRALRYRTIRRLRYIRRRSSP